MSNLAHTVARDERRNAELVGVGTDWLESHKNTPDLDIETEYGYTIGEMLWAAHKYATLHPEDTAPDPTNMLDRVTFARKD